MLAALAGAAAGGVAVALWETIGPGTGHAAASGRLTGARPSTAKPGTAIWRAKVNSPVRYLAVAGGVVYAGSAQHAVYALDAATGKQVWWRATPTTSNGQLVLADGVLVIAYPDDGGVLGLDAATGKQLWSVPSGSTGAAGVLGLVTDGGRVFCGYAAKSDTTGGVTAPSAAAGTLLWTAEFAENLDTNGGLAAASGTVYAATGNGEVYAYDAASGARACGEARRKNAASFRELMSWVMAANSAPGNISAGINCAGVLALAEECARGAGVNACRCVMTIAATAITASALPPNGTIHQVRRPGRGGGQGGTGLVPDEAGSRGGAFQGGRPTVVPGTDVRPWCGRKLPVAAICPPVDDESPRSHPNGILMTSRAGRTG